MDRGIWKADPDTPSVTTRFDEMTTSPSVSEIDDVPILMDDDDTYISRNLNIEVPRSCVAFTDGTIGPETSPPPPFATKSPETSTFDTVYVPPVNRSDGSVPMVN
jgi:hypothetical protein